MLEWWGRGFDDLWDLLLRGPPPYTSTCWPSSTATLLEFPEVLANGPSLQRSSHLLLFGKCRFLLDVFLRHWTDVVFIVHLKIWVWSFLAMSNHTQAWRYARCAFSVYKVKKAGSLLSDIHYRPDAGALCGNWNISFVTDKKKKPLNKVLCMRWNVPSV